MLGKRILHKISDVFAVRTSSQVWRVGPLGRQGDTYDISETAALAAALDTGNYFLQHFTSMKSFETDIELLSYALSVAPKEGLVLEFGVATGRTINHIAKLHSGPVHGFDTFAGLPEHWRENFPAGAFAQTGAPRVRENVVLHVGLFQETLPPFVEGAVGPISFVHIDCDLYGSTATIFKNLGNLLHPGAVIVFDEYWNYPGWRMHEWKAFQEFVSSAAVAYEYIGFVPRHQQVAVRLLESDSRRTE
jgi:Methyltransferase domain